jgi:hypothetical protein
MLKAPFPVGLAAARRRQQGRAHGAQFVAFALGLFGRQDDRVGATAERRQTRR